MVNKIVLEYLRVNRGNYNLVDLKKKILASGHSQKDIDDALIQLNAQSGGNAPSVNATINKINKTNISPEAKPAKESKISVNAIGKKLMKPKKSKKKLIIILSIILLLLILGGGVVWYFWDKIIGLV